MITPDIKRYKKIIETMNMSELVAVINNSRLSPDERIAVELIDIHGNSLKEAADKLNIDDSRKLAKWLQKARIKILKQSLKKI